MTLQQLLGLVLQVSIFATVFGFGLRATGGDVRSLLRQPVLLARSLGALFVVMPLAALALTRLFALPATVEIAMLALAISPTPPLLPGKQGKAGGQASYALGLMVIVSLLAIVVVPAGTAILGWLFDLPLRTPALAVAKVVLLTTLLPLAAGMGVRKLWPALAERISKPIALVATVMLSVGVLALVVASLPAVLRLLGNGTLLVTAAFVAIGLLVGHLAGGARQDQQIVLALSTASRHPAIALAVAGANFPNESQMAPTVILFLLVGGLLSAPYLAWQRRRAARAPSAA